MRKLLVVLAATIVNRIRGGGFSADAWPGHARLYAAAGMVFLARYAGATRCGSLAWGGGFLLWAAPAWGRWQDLGRAVEPDPPGPFETAVECAASLLPVPLDHAALFLRHLLVLPALVAVAALSGRWWLPVSAPVFAALTVGAYEIGHRQTLAGSLVVAEFLTGVLWGVLLVLGAGAPTPLANRGRRDGIDIRAGARPRAGAQGGFVRRPPARRRDE